MYDGAGQETNTAVHREKQPRAPSRRARATEEIHICQRGRDTQLRTGARQKTASSWQATKRRATQFLLARLFRPVFAAALQSSAGDFVGRSVRDKAFYIPSRPLPPRCPRCGFPEPDPSRQLCQERFGCMRGELQRARHRVSTDSRPRNVYAEEQLPAWSTRDSQTNTVPYTCRCVQADGSAAGGME